MSSKVGFEDLFDKQSVSDGISELAQELKAFANDIKNAMATIKEETSKIGESLKQTSPSQSNGVKEVEELSKKVEKLYDNYQKLGLAEEYVTERLAQLIATKDRANKAERLAETANKAEAESLTRLKAELELAKLAYEGMTEAERKEQSQGGQLATLIKKMQTELKEYKNALKAVATQQAQTSQAQTKTATATISLSEAYQSLDSLVQQTGVDLNVLLTSQKDINNASKYGTTANSTLAGSYNQLYAQYNLCKIALNQMGSAMREDINIGKVWEAQALEIMDKMKAMQEATGKHTLSVGDYTKAFNGLNIATQQVLREMPTIANSWSQFFIAISNNVPILTDAFKRVREETGSLSMALKGVATSIFSWQTALLAVLTILPQVVRSIEQKKRAQEEANKQAKEAVSYLKLMEEAELNVGKAEIKQVSDLKTLTRILTDSNRSYEERVKVGRYLKATYEEELEMFTAEEIAMGKAKATLDELTNSLVIQAQARAYLGEIGNLSIKQLELEKQKTHELTQVKNKELELDIARQKVQQALANLNADPSDEILAQAVADATGEVFKLNKELEAQVGNYQEVDSQLQTIENAIADLRDRIKTDGLIIDDEDLGGARSKLDKLSNYYFEWMESIIKTTMVGEEKEVALSDLAFAKRIHSAEQNLMKLEQLEKETGEDFSLQKSYLNEILENLEAERWQAELEIRGKYISKELEQMIKATDEETKAYAKASKKQIEDIVKARKERYDSAVRSADALLTLSKTEATEENRNSVRRQRAIAEAEVVYWQTRIDLAERFGGSYLKDIEKFYAKLREAESKAEGYGERQRGGRQGFLYKFLYGEAIKENTPSEILSSFVSDLQNAFGQAMDYMDEWIEKRMEMADIAIESAQKEKEASKSLYDYELQAMANGYANNVEYARKEYEKKVALEKKAVAEKERLQKVQEAIDTAQQVSSLVTATANLISAYSSIPFAGQVLSAVAIAGMWATFLGAKIMASQVTSKKTYGEGGYEYINYGGSHASGNDVDFGRTRDGKQRRIERGEVVGIINKKNVEKYGVSTISNIINSINNGTFESQYSNVVDSLSKQSVIDRYALAFTGFGGDYNGADLSGVEKGINTLISQNEVRVVTTPTGRIEYRGNNKRIIHNS